MKLLIADLEVGGSGPRDTGKGIQVAGSLRPAFVVPQVSLQLHTVPGWIAVNAATGTQESPRGDRHPKLSLSPYGHCGRADAQLRLPLARATPESARATAAGALRARPHTPVTLSAAWPSSHPLRVQPPASEPRERGHASSPVPFGPSPRSFSAGSFHSRVTRKIGTVRRGDCSLQEPIRRQTSCLCAPGSASPLFRGKGRAPLGVKAEARARALDVSPRLHVRPCSYGRPRLPLHRLPFPPRCALSVRSHLSDALWPCAPCPACRRVRAPLDGQSRQKHGRASECHSLPLVLSLTGPVRLSSPACRSSPFARVIGDLLTAGLNGWS